MLSFLLLNGGVAVAAGLVARAAAGPGARMSHRLLATLAGALVAVHAVVLAAGLLGALTPRGLGALVAGAVLAAAWIVRRVRREAPRGGDAKPPGFLARVIAMLALACGVAWAWPHLAGATRLWIWDDYTYHVVYPALWLRDGAIAAATPERAFTMQAWYPLSASVVATWFMVPFAASRADALAWVSLTGVLYAGLVAGGAAEALARVGCRRGAWAMPLVLFFTSRRIDVMASSFSDADLAVAATLFAAFVFAVPRGDTEGIRDVRADAWYAALLAGLAVGVKVSAAPTAAILLLMIARRAGSPRARVGAVLVFAAAFAVTGAYWYARNAVHTGNPVYPAAFLAWPGATFPQTTLREYAQRYGLARAVGDALVVYLDWPRFHALVAVLGLAGVGAWALARRHVVTRSQALFAGGTLAIAVVTLVLLPGTPYSAGNGMTFVSGFIHWDSMRYVALLPILGWVALGVLLDAGAGPRRTAVTIAVALGALATSATTAVAAVIVLAAALLLAAVGPWLRAPAPRVSVTAAALVIAALVAWSHGAKAAATAAAFHREPLFGAAAAVLDRLPPGTRVAVFGDQWIYPAFGARHDLVPVRLDGDGAIATAPVGDAMAPGPLTVDASVFRANLARSRIDAVAVVHLPHPGRSPEWPAQAAALEAAGGTRLVHRDSAVGIWTLTR